MCQDPPDNPSKFSGSLEVHTELRRHYTQCEGLSQCKDAGQPQQRGAVWSRVQRKPSAGFQWPLTLVLLYTGKCSYMGFIHIQYTFCILVNYLCSLFTISPFPVMIFLWVTSLFGNKFTLAFSITWAINLTLSTLLLEFVFSILSWTFSVYFRMDEKSWKQSIDPNTEHTWGGTVP